MQIKIIGGHGGVAPGFKATSYLIDKKLLIDAGSVASGLHFEEQAMIENILISHSHLDHICQIAFLCDNTFGMKDSPFELYASNQVTKAIKDHILNDVIWPDFTKLPNEKDPTIRFNQLEENKEIKIGNYFIRPVRVNHPGQSYGFIITNNDTSILFTQDTGPTDQIWKEANKLKNLKAIFTEVSFPNHMQSIADASHHFTPKTLNEEINKMPKDIPIFAGHLKPNFQAQLHEQIAKVEHRSRITLLASDNVSYIF